jgi:cation transport ATPase
MSVPNERHNSPGPAFEASIAPHSSCESCGELSADHAHEHGFELIEVLRVVFVTLAATAVWFHLWEPFHRISVIGLVATLIGGYPIFKESLENIVERRMTMELSMTIALLSALAIGEYFTALVITAFVLGAEILEGLTVGRGRRAIQDMLNFLPQTASVLRAGKTLDVPTDTILPGEIVLIRPGDRIPVDGQVVSGHSFVEEAAITGEPMPSEKMAGSAMYAGTINQTGTLHVLVERLGKQTTFGKIIEAVERAEQSRAPIQKTADRLAGYLVYFALGRHTHFSHYAQHTGDHLRHHRGGRLRHRRGNAAGSPRGRRARGTAGVNHQRRHLSVGPGSSGYGLLRQDWHPDVWHAAGHRRQPRAGCLRTGTAPGSR